MFQSFALAAALASSTAFGLNTTQLDVNALYKGINLAQTKSSSQSEDLSFHMQKRDPLCLMQVHSVKPNLDVPKVPAVSSNGSSGRELPPALKRRLQRRYEQRGMQVPDYLRESEGEQQPAQPVPQVLKQPQPQRLPQPQSEPQRLPQPQPQPQRVPEPQLRAQPYRAPEPAQRQLYSPPAPQPQEHKEEKQSLSNMIVSAFQEQQQPAQLSISQQMPEMDHFGSSNGILSKDQYMDLRQKDQLSSAEQLLVGYGYKEESSDPFGMSFSGVPNFEIPSLDLSTAGKDFDLSDTMSIPDFGDQNDGFDISDATKGIIPGPGPQGLELNLDIPEQNPLSQQVPEPTRCPLSTSDLGCMFGDDDFDISENHAPMLQKPTIDFGDNFGFGDDGDLDLGFDLSKYIGGPSMKQPAKHAVPAVSAPHLGPEGIISQKQPMLPPYHQANPQYPQRMTHGFRQPLQGRQAGPYGAPFQGHPDPRYSPYDRYSSPPQHRPSPYGRPLGYGEPSQFGGYGAPQRPAYGRNEGVHTSERLPYGAAPVQRQASPFSRYGAPDRREGASFARQPFLRSQHKPRRDLPYAPYQQQARVTSYGRIPHPQARGPFARRPRW